MKIFELIEKSDAVKALLEQREGVFVVDDSLALSFSLVAAYLKQPKNILIVAPNLYGAQAIYEQISSLIGEDNVLFYPFDEIIRIDQISSSKEMVSQRLYVMSQCINCKNKILITHASASLRYIPDKNLFVKHILELKVGESYKTSDLVNILVDNGFKRVGKIDQSLQFALRGDILDVFPINENNPIRIEFFDDEIESMRYFDIASQRSLNQTLDLLYVYPSNELLYEKSNFEICKTKVLQYVENNKKAYGNMHNQLLKKVNFDLETIKENGFTDSLYSYFSFFDDSNTSILDYFDADLTILYSYDKIISTFEMTKNELDNYFTELFNNGLCIKNPKYFKNINVLNSLNHIKTQPYFTSSNDYTIKLRGIISGASNMSRSIELMNEYIENKKKVLVCLNAKELVQFKNFLSSESYPFKESLDGETDYGIVYLYPLDLKEGFELIDEDLIVLTKKEVLGQRNYSNRYMARYKKAEVLNSYEDLHPGDYVVHEINGIGKFIEVTTIEVDGEPRDYLKIKYAGEDELLIPLEKFYLIRKYVSQEGAVPKLSKIGGGEWKKSKAKIKEKINVLAERLIELYAKRQEVVGIKYDEDDEFQKSFEDCFPYPLTGDQIRSVNEIKKDMMSSHPMDRLLCGDVGFGKTEVAFRAAFKAMLCHKQVMMLCPTTILAKQHYEVAFSRFASFGIKIALFSRFVPLSRQKEYIEGIKNGKYHLIIGTHRILSKDIVVPDLGLLIVDEEQRFGVEHKERIKEIAQNIDVLTLSATPIPRTLQMSLLGIRNLSTLDQAPSNRMPVQTYVVPKNNNLIIQVIERELSRDGQVFYLHNRVSTIYQTARNLQIKIPKAKVGVVHGKMDKEDVDEIMNEYYQGEINILVCTSIIETGLDIPNANTIIIENADKFGLSQLYQIKGRVGRSSRVAYAYLLIDPDGSLSPTAEKRLKAIKDFTELGSGYKIAQRDLNIRGAGDILGAEQSGFVDTVGMDMYYRILKEVLDEKKGIKEKKEIIRPLNISLSGYIPSSYASDSDKIQIYQEIEDVNTIAGLELLRRKLRDIYGRLPSAVENLLRKRKVDILAASPDIEEIRDEEMIVVVLSKEFNKIPRVGVKLTQQLYEISQNLALRLDNGKIVIRLIKDKEMLKNLEFLLETIVNLRTREGS